MNPTSWPITRSVLWRIWKERGGFFVIGPLGFALTVVFVCVIAVYVSDVLTSPTAQALDAGLSRYAGGVHNDAAVIIATLLTQAPQVLLITSAASGATIGHGFLATEGARGSLEVLAAGPFGWADVLRQVHLALTIAVAVNAALMAALIGFAVVVFAVIGGIDVAPLLWRLVMLVVLPVPFVAWATAAATSVEASTPSHRRVAPTAASLKPLIVILPAIVTVITAIIWPRTDPMVQFAIGAVTTGALAVLVASRMGRTAYGRVIVGH